MPSLRLKISLVIPLSLACFLALAQEDSLKATSLDEVTIHGYRIPVAKNEMPYSITKLDLSESKNSMQQLSLNEFIGSAPGIFALNSDNFAQDLRISMRGFGARSAFGIRGIKILVDGIPETTPDGQGQVDNINLDIIDHIEIIRGTSSTLYGNASGGVINIATEDFVAKSFVRPSIGFGGFGMRQFQLSSGLRRGKSHYLFHGSALRTDGFREQSSFETYNFNARMKYQLGESSILNIQANYANSPYAGDPGGLTLEEVSENRQQARQRNIDYNSREEVEQFKLGTSFVKSDKYSTFKVYAFYIARDFWASLPFESSGIVSLTRNYFGQGIGYSFNHNLGQWKHQIQIGYDLADQADHRTRFRNIDGQAHGRSFEQIETFRNLGAFALNHFSKDSWRIVAGIRYDINSLSADDLYLSNDDQSGNVDYYTFNPSVGVSYKLVDNHFLHVNFSTGFETPVLSELSATPSGGGGFSSLQPQFADNYEIGYKAKSPKTSFEASVFYIDSRGDLVPYELEDFPGRTFYRNAGATNRRGLEVSYSHSLNSKLEMLWAYTFSDFRYGSYATPDGDVEGKTLPGIPIHLGAMNIVYSPFNWVRIRLNSQYRGELYVNDQNDVKDDDFVVSNINFSFKYSIKDVSILPYVGINNLFNTRYNDNIRINAFGGRYYEPAPGFNIYVGLRARI